MPKHENMGMKSDWRKGVQPPGMPGRNKGPKKFSEASFISGGDQLKLLDAAKRAKAKPEPVRGD